MGQDIGLQLACLLAWCLAYACSHGAILMILRSCAVACCSIDDVGLEAASAAYAHIVDAVHDSTVRMFFGNDRLAVGKDLQRCRL